MEIKTKNGNILVVEITSEEDLMFDNIEARIISQLDDAKIIGKLSELKDEDVEEFVDRYTFNETGLSYANEMYKYYGQCVGFPIISAKESFLSLLAANGLNTNKEFLIVKIYE